jgi:hypothetical protein
MKRTTVRNLLLGVLILGLTSGGFAAYHHMGEMDSGIFLGAYAEKAGTKLDSCTLCHSGGSYVQNGKTVTLGSCQWCHYKYGYDASGEIEDTLNSYGKAYNTNGRSLSALKSIENLDSDGDGYSNKIEIDALRFPGDASDDPNKVPAPYQVFSRADLDKLPQHTQFLLMNAHKSTDFYATYRGVSMEDLLESAGMLPTASNIKVFAPDGFAQYFSLNPDPNPILYHVFGAYPASVFYYDEEADVARNPAGWCDYDSPDTAGMSDGDPIANKNGLKLMLATLRDGGALDSGVLTPQNKLDGEGPFRVVPPQKIPGPPDQRSTAVDQEVVWPFDANADHNAGYSPRSATIIKVDPLPEGTTDIDLLEAGWKYIDESKIVVYGAIHPGSTILAKLDALIALMESSDRKAYKNVLYKKLLVFEAQIVRQFAKCGKYKAALSIIEKGILTHADGCNAGSGGVDRNDWVKDCELQKKIYWSLNELIVLFGIIV